MSNQTDDAKRRVNQLRHLQAWETHAARLIAGWQPAVRLWEAKHSIGLHLWQDMQCAREIRTRLWELRVSRPDSAEVNESVLPAIKTLACAQQDFELVGGVYLGVKKALAKAYRDYLAETPANLDAPSIDILNRAAACKESQIEWAEAYLAHVATSEEQKHIVARWSNYATEVVAAVGGVDGEGRAGLGLPALPPGYGCLLPFGEAKRDARFKVQLQGFDRPPIEDTEAHTLWQFVSYAMEMQAAETLGSVLWEVEGMEWDFYYDVARHCYDECRHSQMGEERVRELGHELHEFPQFTGNFAWRQLYDPMRRYCMLTYIIEQDSFALKHETYKNYIQSGDTASAEAIMYDIIDETMHVRWGKKWVPELMAAQGETADLDSVIGECRQLVLDNSLAPAQRESARA